MDNGIFIFTCKYEPNKVSHLFDNRAFVSLENFNQVLNANLSFVCQKFLPPIQAILILKIEPKLTLRDKPMLVFYSRPVLFTSHEKGYLIMMPAISKAPVLFDIDATSDYYELEIEKI
ncbi:hypothetical protein [Pedobacter insulae]|nr:hypothetical protein [Pedobacter insulae]